jgi:hypothetical protein
MGINNNDKSSAGQVQALGNAPNRMGAADGATSVWCLTVSIEE